MNYALFRMFAGLNYLGICLPLPWVAVSKAAITIRESLKDPSSYTTPVLYLSDKYGKNLLNYDLCINVGKWKKVEPLGAYHA